MSTPENSSSVVTPRDFDQGDEVELLTAVNDDHGGVIVEMKGPMNSGAFVSSLRASIVHWRKQGKRGVWIKLPIGLVSLVQPAVEEGFWYHHAEPSYLMLAYWIPDTKHTLPVNATHRVGVGAFVMNDKRELLVVQEKNGKFRGSGVWKFPTGVVDQGEDIVAGAEGVPKRLTYDEIQSKTYMEVKGTGTANQCPTIEGGVESLAFKPGKYTLKKLCLEPTSFTVKAEGVNKNSVPEFQRTKLMTRLTYTLDEIEGPFEVGADGTVKFEEKDGIDYAAVTVQLPGGERVPFLFTIKQLVASGKPESFSGPFLVPSYRGSSFLDPKGRGGSAGYDSAVALPAGGRGDEEELVKENLKDTSSSTGNITLSVSKSRPDTSELIGVFESVQPSDTDMGAKAPKEVKIQGIWYAQLE